MARPEFARITDALRHANRTDAPPGPPPSGAAVDEDLVRAFDQALRRADGRLVRVTDAAEARRWLAENFDEERTAWLDEAPSEDALRAADVGVDRADLLIAETGTVVRSYASREASRISLVPETSIFLAERKDLVRDLPTALGRIADRHRAGSAYTVLVTGPSRTADIEKQLVIPAHGPRELVVLLCEV